MFDRRTRLSFQVADEVRRHLDGTVYDTVVPRSVRLSGSEPWSSDRPVRPGVAGSPRLRGPGRGGGGPCLIRGHASSVSVGDSTRSFRRLPAPRMVGKYLSTGSWPTRTSRGHGSR